MSLRTWCTGDSPVHIYRKLHGYAAGVTLAASLFVASAPAAAAPGKAAQGRPAAAAVAPRPDTVAEFYRARGGAPLWFAPQAGSSAQQLLSYLDTAWADGLNPERYRTPQLQDALRAAWGGDPRAVRRADQLLSEAFVNYVRDLRRDPNLGIIYVDYQLRPAPPSVRSILSQAASATSLDQFVRDMGWMNPVYGQLRQAIANNAYATEHERQLLALNRERARALPAGVARYILVNAAQQRLFVYENGRVVDSMRVVVGKPKHATPMLSAYIRFAALNPYWYVPPDLAAERIAPFVVKGGVGYLKKKGYEVLSDWGNNPQIIDPTTIDWKAVADGKVEVRIRQLPGDENAMGRMKFMFPNDAGIYLHDTPEKQLLTEASRLFSGGCVRLEDAPRLGRWLFGRELHWEGAGTEEQVPLATPVQVHITYLTAMPEGASIAYFDDIYGRDKERLAALGVASVASR